MRSRKLSESGNLAHEIVELACEGKRVEEIVEIAKRLLDLTLNYDVLPDYTRVQMIGRICWKFGLEPPDSIQNRLV